MSRRDPVGGALASLGAGAAVGAAVVTAALIILRTVQRQASGDGDSALQATIIGAGLFAGIVTAVATAWSLSPTLDPWRRSVTSALAVFAGTILAVGAAPADLAGGRVGLAVYAVLLLSGATYWGVRAHKAAPR
jgi:hypothetical protein